VSYIWILIIASYPPVLLASFVIFDRIVMAEYFAHRTAWYSDGQPHGIFWVPPECTFAGGWLVRFSSSMANRRIMRLWLFSTPDWMTSDRSALRLLYWWRALVVGWLAALAGFFMVLILRY
jgi:hypothetical protein